MPDNLIVAVFENRERADAAVRELTAAGIPQSQIHQFDREHPARGEVAAAAAPAPREGFWAWLFGTDEGSAADHRVFEDTVQRGGTVVTVTADPVEHDRIVRLLEALEPIDLDERSRALETSRGDFATSSGVEQSRAAASAPATGIAAINEAAGTPSTTTESRTAERSGAAEGERVIPLAEEQLQVGKRMVETGRTRIRRYVVESPVEERVRLRTERVVIERRRPVSGAEPSPDAFTETETEITERGETPVVQKAARVGEEVVVRTDVGEREETVRDTVRKQDVEVTREGGSEHRAQDTGAMPNQPERASASADPMQGTGAKV